MNSEVGIISEAPTTVTSIHDKEVVTSDAYVNMELELPRRSDNGTMHAVVKWKKLDNYGKTIGTEHSNQLIDTRAYAVVFIGGTTETLTANSIAGNVLAQVDEEGHRKLILDKIIDYRRNIDEVCRDDSFVETLTGMRLRKMNTKDW